MGKNGPQPDRALSQRKLKIAAVLTVAFFVVSAVLTRETR